MHIEPCSSLQAIDASQWNALTNNHPLLSHAFLAGLEKHGCVGGNTGWQSAHLLAWENNQLVGALPRYYKEHSWGEFVFDHAWADASHQAGLPYYPKSLIAIPFTPHPSRRILVSDNADTAIADALVEADWQDNHSASSHFLFINEADKPALTKQGYLFRRGCQYHWRNHGYKTFDDFLATLTASRRKKLKRERRRVAENGIRIERLHGHEVPEQLWPEVYALYASSFAIRGNPPYYTQSFLEEVCPALGNQALLVLCWRAEELVACAILFNDHHGLYGRHWGAKGDFNSLHFEACFYQGIEYAIEKGLHVFEPGAQGEHKITRGFEPTATWSAHKLRHTGLHDAVADFVNREAGAVEQWEEKLSENLPFRQVESH